MDVVMHVYQCTTPQKSSSHALRIQTPKGSSLETGNIFELAYSARRHYEKLKAEYNNVNLSVLFAPRADIEWVNAQALTLCVPLGESAKSHFWETFIEEPRTASKVQSR